MTESTYYGGDKRFILGKDIGTWEELVKQHGTPVTVGTVKPDDVLVSTQDVVLPDVLDRYRNGTPGPDDKPSNPPKIFVSKYGTKHVLNGHHRLLVNRAAGKNTHALFLKSSNG